jgi:hypothetical protein
VAFCVRIKTAKSLNSCGFVGTKCLCEKAFRKIVPKSIVFWISVSKL